MAKPKNEANNPDSSAQQANPELEALKAQLAKAEAENAQLLETVQVANTNAALAEQERLQAVRVAETFRDQASALEDQVTRLSTDALHNPVVRETRHEMPEQFDMGSAYFGDAEDQPIDLVIPQFVNDAEAAKKHNDELAFMAESVVIQFHSTNERNAMQLFPIGHNGRKYLFERGKKYRVPRYVVSTLMESMPETFGCVEYVDPSDGVKKIKYPGTAGLRFPFSVLQDNQNGLRWFARKGTGYNREVHL